jgi:hypothetical protein
LIHLEDLHPSPITTTIVAAVAVLQQQGHHGRMVDISGGDAAHREGIRKLRVGAISKDYFYCMLVGLIGGAQLCNITL